jgi:hypothetical protein
MPRWLLATTRRIGRRSSSSLVLRELVRELGIRNLKKFGKIHFFP